MKRRAAAIAAFATLLGALVMGRAALVWMAREREARVLFAERSQVLDAFFDDFLKRGMTVKIQPGQAMPKIAGLVGPSESQGLFAGQSKEWIIVLSSPDEMIRVRCHRAWRIYPENPTIEIRFSSATAGPFVEQLKDTLRTRHLEPASHKDDP